MREIGLIKPLKRYWYQCALYILFSYCLTQVIVHGTNRLAEITDSLFKGEEIVLEKLLLFFVILMLLGATAAFGKSLLKDSFSLNMQTDIRTMTTEKLVKLPYSYLDKTGTGELMNKLISDVYQMEVLFSEVLPEMLMSLVTIITVGVYMQTVSIRLLIVTVVCYPLLLWFANKLSRSFRKLTGKRRNLYDELENVAFDVFQGVTIERSFDLYEVQRARIEKVIDGILANEYSRTIIGMLSFVMGDIVRWLPRMICYLFAMYEAWKNNITIGEMMAYVMLLDQIVRPLGSIPRYMVNVRECMVSFNRLQDVMGQSNEESGEGSFWHEDCEPIMELQHVYFAYEEGKEVVTDISLEIKEGENIAIVGSSGSGKTTIMKLLCGFYQPQKGECRMYGHSFQEWDMDAMRKQLVLVSQNVFLFPGTIAENVAYGKKDATREEIIEACKNANIHDFIIKLPKGYDTLVGERGARLSGGQRQRISIARAFLKNAPILLLDEPTSAVDVETEQLIQEAMKRISGSRTMITIAHRLSTIKEADVIYVFEKGKMVESGTHSQLLSQNGVYGALYQKETEGDMAYEL